MTSRGTRQAAAGVAAAIVLFVCAGVALRSAPARQPVGDVAVIEIDVLHSLNGFWPLGSYSRYGWRHPGPLQFYLLAPLYWLSGTQSAALPAGALLLNLGCLAFVAWAAKRHLPPGTALAVSVAAAALAVRADGLLTSIWNPHAVVFPLAATVLASALAAAGHPWFLLAAVAGASFLAQTHVGLAAIAVVLIAAPALVLIAGAIRHRRVNASAARRNERALVAALVLGALLWAPPLIQQATARPGNITELAAFFLSADRTGQPVSMAARIAAYESAALWWPGLDLPWGRPLQIPHSRTWLIVSGGQALAIGLLLAAWARRGRDERWWLGLMTLAGAGAGVAASTRIESPVPGYMVFWLSAVGAIGAGVIAGAILDAIAARAGGGGRPGRWGRWGGWMCAAAVGVTAVAGTAEWRRVVHRAPLDVEAAAAVWAVNGALQHYYTGHAGEVPLIRVSQSNWGETAGVVLQLYKAHRRFTVETDWVVMFGEPFAPTGRETQELFLADGPDRKRLLKTRDVTILADTTRLSALVTGSR